MKDEIKEIDRIITNVKRTLQFSPERRFVELFNKDEINKLLDYITNLQEEVEDLRESDWAWHQTLKIQNKREYRSKFLKEFQQEYNTNTFPDYDEIYKRYDKLKKENEKLKEIVENLTTMTVCGDRKQIKNTAQYKLDIYKSRNEKAIYYIWKEIEQEYDEENNKWLKEKIDNLLNILQGDDKDVKN